MAAGTLVVCPDCVGNRTFCVPGRNSFRPAWRLEDIATAVEAALALPEPKAAALRQQAVVTASGYSLAHARASFHEVLANLDELWSLAKAGVPAWTATSDETVRRRREEQRHAERISDRQVQDRRRRRQQRRAAVVPGTPPDPGAEPRGSRPAHGGTGRGATSVADAAGADAADARGDCERRRQKRE